MKLPPLVKKTVTIALIAGVAYGGYAYFFKKSTTTAAFTTVTTKVKKGDIANTVQVIGVSALVHEQKMQFSQGGKVAKIFFKEGDAVKKGQIMAELDTTDVLNDIRQQEVNLENAQVKLTQTLKWAEAKDILNAENAVTSARSKITTLENDRVNLLRDKANKITDYDNQITAKQNDIRSNENDIANKRAQLENAKRELVTLEQTEDKSLSDASTDTAKILETALIDARKQLIDAESSLYSADEILGVSEANRTKNDSYEMVLAAKNSALKTLAENDWNRANTLLAVSKSSMSTLTSTGYDAASVRSFLGGLSSLEDALVTLGKDGKDMMNASVTSANLSQSTIESDASIFGSITSTAQSALSSIKTTIVNIDKLTDPSLKQASSTNTISAKRQSIADQEYAIQKLAIDTAQKLENDLAKLRSDQGYSSDSYDAQLVAKDADIENAKNALKYNEESLRLLKAGATQEEIALAKNSIALQRISLEKVREGIKKYQLEAPFDGVLRKIDFKVGDNIVTSSSATPEYLYIENPNLVEITATVDQLDVVKLQLGQDAKIVFDSFPTLTFTGEVSDINSTPTQTSGVTSYTIKITMDKGKHAIFSGMSAKTDIVIESKQETLIVPTSFLQKGRGQTVVLKRIGTTDTRTEVVVGISTPSNTEIVSGVNEWDTIVRRIATSTGSTSPGSLIPAGGGGNRGTSGGGWNGWGGGGNFRGGGG